MQTSTIKNDTTDLLAAMEDKAPEKEIGLINIRGKDKNQRMN